MGNILLIVLMLATLLALVVGVGMMAVGGEANKKFNNKMMMLRVALQAAALAVLAVLLLVGR